jgi:hypothetical protein
MKLTYNPSTFDFYKHPDRIGETVNIREKMFQIFDDIYLRLRIIADNSKRISSYPSINDHPFFLKLDEIIQNPTAPDENAKCDEVFAFYIYKVSKYARPEFFARVLKFVVLFRECLNLIYKERAKSKSSDYNPDYSEIFNPEDAPDISNDFVTEYLGTDTCQLDFKREEAIDITHNFCQWLYDNNYTCSKLSLISNY